MARYGMRIPVLRHTNSGRELDWPFGPNELVHFLNNLTCSAVSAFCGPTDINHCDTR
jgi:hypothetical protein